MLPAKMLFFRLNKAAIVNLGVVMTVIVIHCLMLFSVGDDYRTALHTFSASTLDLSKHGWASVVTLLNICFAFTGWFFLPLLYCLWTSASTLYAVIKADMRQKPLPRLECGKLLYGDATSDGALYTGGALALFLGMSGTLFYIMWGLYLMGQSMTDMAVIVSASGAGGDLAKLLPFGKMAGAAHKIVPALGTTLVGLTSQMIVKYAEKRVHRWHPNIGSSYPWASGKMDLKQLVQSLVRVAAKAKGGTKHADGHG